MKNVFVDNIDFINEFLGLELSFRNGMFISDRLFFYSIKNVFLYYDKTFEAEKLMKKGSPLDMLRTAYQREAEPKLLNYEWKSISSNFLNDTNGYFDKDRIFIATKEFELRASWGRQIVQKKNRLKYVYTLDGYETGVMVIRNAKDAIVFSPTKSYLKPINYDINDRRAFLRSFYTTRNTAIVKHNVFVSEEIDSLLEFCRAGLLTSITTGTNKESDLVLKIVHKDNPEYYKDLFINKKNVMYLVNKYIDKMSAKDTILAVSSVVKMCKETGFKIPEKVASLSILHTNLIPRVSKKIHDFVFNILDTYYVLTKSSPVVLSEKYGPREYYYMGPSDYIIAKQIVSSIRRIQGVKDSLKDISIQDMIFLVHDYIENEYTPIESFEESYQFSGVKMQIDYTNSRILFFSLEGKRVGRQARYLLAHKKLSKEYVKVHREDTFSYLFKDKKNSSRAIISTYAFSIASILDIPYSIKIFAVRKMDKRNILRFFEAPAFNIAEASFKNADVKNISSKDIVIASNGEEVMYNRSIIITENDADIHMKNKSFSDVERAYCSSLSHINPDRHYVYGLARVLNGIAEQFNTVEDAREALSDKDELERFIIFYMSF